ncbi:MAG TPA: wax ester/triacylglycerol synthase family O-acyltransferase [Mycobacteriales bacterium]|jgi:diacylglycerol O-acyltransferase|nr:wax ester/triacylglycerol synthase family O-acyltransferase [Mycobacteriales bacterium]
MIGPTIGGMDAMSPLDAAFLVLEDADAHAGLHIGSVGIFEGPVPSHESFLEGFSRKLSLVPRYRQRFQRVPFSLGPPVWVDDETFDINYHVRRTALPRGADDAMLRRLVGRVMSQRLDRDKPMWEAWVVEGLPDGRWALLSKVHHCLVDGISGTDALAVMLDLSAEAEWPPASDWVPRPAPSGARLAVEAVAHQLTEPLALARATVRLVRAPRSALRTSLVVGRGLAALGGATAPTDLTSLVGHAGSHRRYRFAAVPFADVQSVRRQFGGTVNDVALAAVTAGFRELLESRGEHPTKHSVRTLVPVSTRTPGEESIRDNRVSALLLDLPVWLADPVEQLRAVQVRSAQLKTSGEADAGSWVTRLAQHLPFDALEPTLRTAFRLPQRSLTTVTTNVPGPPFPLYAFGCRMLHAYPYVPIADRLRVGVAMFSYNGEFSFGVTSDAETTPDADVLIDGILRGLQALVDRTRTGRQRAPSVKKTAAPAAVAR